MDDPDCDPTRLRATLRRFGMVNRLVSGWGTVYRTHARAQLAGLGRPARVLDLGCGGGDVVARLAGSPRAATARRLVARHRSRSARSPTSRGERAQPGVEFRVADSASWSPPETRVRRGALEPRAAPPVRRRARLASPRTPSTLSAGRRPARATSRAAAGRLRRSTPSASPPSRRARSCAPTACARSAAAIARRSCSAALPGVARVDRSGAVPTRRPRGGRSRCLT